MDAFDQFLLKRAQEQERKVRDAIRKPCPLDYRFMPSETSGDNHPSGYVETRERDVDEAERFIPYRVLYDEASGTWFRVGKQWYPITRPRTECAVPGPGTGRTWVAFAGGVELWRYNRPNWYQAMEEARRLCQIAGYNPRKVKVKWAEL